jgi:hypothetical protein
MLHKIPLNCFISISECFHMKKRLKLSRVQCNLKIYDCSVFLSFLFCVGIFHPMKLTLSGVLHLCGVELLQVPESPSGSCSENHSLH